MAFDFIGAATSLVGGGGSSDSLSSIGSLVGSAVPLPFASQIGGAVGSLLGKAGSLFKGHQFDAQGMFAGLHSPTLPNMDDSKFYKEDAKVYVDYANALGISVEEVALVMNYDGAHSEMAKKSGRDPFAYAFDAWRSPINATTALSWMRGYNRDNPLAQIHPGELGPRSTGDYNSIVVPEARPTMTSLRADLAQKGIGSQVIESAPVSTSELGDASTVQHESAPVSTSNSFAGFSKDEIQGILKGGLSGAQKGVIDAAMNTSVGKQAQNSGAKQFANDNGLVIGLVLAGIGCGFTYLIATRK